MSRLEIIDLFATELGRELTIRQISKLVNKSYAFTNKELNLMFDQGIFHKKVIGPSILCSLNFKNELTRGFLVLNSIMKKQRFFEKNKELKNKLENFLQELEKKAIVHSVLLSKNDLIVICEEGLDLKDILKLVPPPLKLSVIEKKEFHVKKIKEKLKDLIIIQGHEIFWKLVGDAFE